MISLNLTSAEAVHQAVTGAYTTIFIGDQCVCNFLDIVQAFASLKNKISRSTQSLRKPKRRFYRERRSVPVALLCQMENGISGASVESFCQSLKFFISNRESEARSSSDLMYCELFMGALSSLW